MECGRCHGLMAKERLYEFLENDGQLYVGGWQWVTRCNGCGNVTDCVDDQNRQTGSTAIIVAS
jgi:adenine-specific DNA methylase